MLRTIDLFAGAGGLSLGFQLTGCFDIVVAAEINKYARETYKANIAKNASNFVFIENVLGYDFTALNEQLGGIDVVIVRILTFPIVNDATDASESVKYDKVVAEPAMESATIAKDKTRILPFIFLLSPY